MKLIRMHDSNDCGAACLASVIGFYGRKVPLADIRQAIKLDRNGSSIYGIIEGARTYGLSSEAFRGTPEDAWVAIAVDREYPLPLMIRIRNGEYEHFTVVSSVKRDRIFVLDPKGEKRWVQKQEFLSVFLGEVVTFSPSQEFRTSNDKKNYYARYTHMIMQQRGLLAAAASLSLIIVSIAMAGTFLLRYIIDTVVPSFNTGELLEENIEVLCLVIFAVGVMYMIRFLLSLLRAKVLASVGRRVDLSLIIGCFNHVTKLPASFLGTMKTGEIMSRFEDAGKIREAVSASVVTITLNSLMVIVCGGALYMQSPKLFKAAVTVFLAYLVVAVVFIKPIEKSNRDVMLQNAEFTQFLKESIDGIETIKVTGSEDLVRRRGEDIYRPFVDTGVRNGLICVTKDSIITLITSIGTLFVLYLGTIQILEGGSTVGTMITFISLMECFLDPIQGLVDLQGDIQSAVIAADRLNDIMMSEEEEVTGINADTGVGQIEFSHVSFRYGNRERVLKDVSFVIGAGQRVALIGESGCGKSTVSKLALRLHSPEKGRILVNGLEIEGVSTEYLRRQIAYVPQTTFLFSDSIRNNLLLSARGKEIPMETLEQILDVACCQFIKNLPMGIDSVLEENGANLSGGQKQRVAIARALLGSPSVLILDESTSALDAATERKILDSIQETFPSITIIAVTHRMRSVINFDKIYVMEDGCVTGSGTHQELLRENALYADLWRAQEDCTGL